MLSGAIAQLGERLICIQEVVGSIPSGSTIIRLELKKFRIMLWRFACCLYIVKSMFFRVVCQ